MVVLLVIGMSAADPNDNALVLELFHMVVAPPGLEVTGVLKMRPVPPTVVLALTDPVTLRLWAKVAVVVGISKLNGDVVADANTGMALVAAVNAVGTTGMSDKSASVPLPKLGLVPLVHHSALAAGLGVCEVRISAGLFRLPIKVALPLLLIISGYEFALLQRM